MFTMKKTGLLLKKNRLVAEIVLTRKEFQEVAAQLGVAPIRARKLGFVAARKAKRVETVVTLWNGQETTNSAQLGDWIATNLSPDREVLRDKDGNASTYVIKADTFPNLYEPSTGRNEFGQFFKAKGIVDSIHLAGGFDIVAPWGERQTAREGYLILNGEEVYGNNRETFDATYELIDR